MTAVNPVFRRELISVLESRTTYLLAWFYLLGGGLMVYLGWPESERVMQGTSVARRLFQSFCLLQLGALGVFLPALVAPVLAKERERNCYDFLVTTPLNNAALLSGKLAPAIVFISLLILGALPFTSACTLLGGLTTVEVLSGTLVLMSAGLVFAALSCFFPALLDSTQAALAASYLTVLPLALWSAMALGYAGVLSSPLVLPLVLTVALASAMTLVAIAAALFAHAAKQGREGPDRRKFSRTERALIRFLGGYGVRKEQSPSKALAAKEVLCDFFTGRSRWLRLVFWGGVIITLLMSTLPFENRTDVYVVSAITLVLLLGGATAATVFSRERESLTLEGLAVLPLKPGVVLRAKYATPLKITVLLGIILTAPMILAGVFGFAGVADLLFFILAILVLGDVAVTVGVLCSLVSSTTSLAVTRTYALLAFIVGAPLVARVILDTAVLSEEGLSSLLHGLSPYLFFLDGYQMAPVKVTEGIGMLLVMLAVGGAGKLVMRLGFRRWVCE